MVGGGLHKGRSVMDKKAGERGQFQSRVGGMVGVGGGGEECRCDNEGIQWTSQPASGERKAHAAATEQAVIFYFFIF